MALPDRSIKIAVDRGGTFTDVHASWPEPSGETKEIILKLLSSDPSHYVDAPREGVRRVLELATGNKYSREEKLPVDKIDSIRLSTTVATNALLERKGAKHALLVTKGFRDLLQIGNQSRPRIFDLDIRKPGVLYDGVVEVDERVTLVGYTSDPKQAERAVVFAEDGSVEKGYDGQASANKVVKGLSGEAVEILKTPDLAAVKKDLQKLFDDGYRSLAVVLVHSFTFPDHELAIAQVAEKIGFENISLSSQTMKMIRVVARGTSTTADAYLTPVLRKYIDGFFSGFDPSLRDSSLAESTSAEEVQRTTSVEFMRSDGGLTDVRGFSGLKSILSGPAGGVVGYALTSWEEGGKAVIGLDMGGTSTDVSRFDGTFEIVFETTTAGVTIQSPQQNISTVAAGGGSRLFWRNGLFVTGPESAGSDPGPACYRKGGPPAITDANLVLGRLFPEYFPKIFGPKEDEALDVEASTKALEDLRSQINKETDGKLSIDEVAYGFVKVANETMSRPIRSLTEARGFDTGAHVLSSFGGAGGQHACAIASTLGITQILIHRFSSVLSAYGMALADRVFEKQEPEAATWSSTGAVPGQLAKRLDALEKTAKEELKKQGFADDRIVTERYLNMRYNGTDTALMTLEVEGQDFGDAFAAAYKQEFGFSMDASIIIDDVRVKGIGKSFDTLGRSVFSEAASLSFTSLPRASDSKKCAGTSSVYFESTGRTDAPVYLLEHLSPGDQAEGPAMIIDGTQTVVIDPGWEAKITSKHVLMDFVAKKPQR